MTCDRCPISLLCLGGCIKFDEVAICARCHRVIIESTNPRNLFTCANLDQLEDALNATRDYTAQYPRQYCPQCKWIMQTVHRWDDDRLLPYYYDLDRDEMRQAHY